jgi:cytochrome c
LQASGEQAVTQRLWKYQDLKQIWIAVALILVAAGLSGCAFGQTPVYTAVSRVPGGDPDQGYELLLHYGCQSCHIIPGVAGHGALVGPRLEDMDRQSFVAGVVANTPDNLVFFIQAPQRVNPLSGMPALGVTEQEARHMAAYLYEAGRPGTFAGWFAAGRRRR